MNLLPTITALGFALLTALFFGLVLRNLRSALQLTNWTNQRQRKIQSGALLIIIGWAVLVAIASISGYTQRFDWFPINLGPILIIPLVGILILTFSKGTAEVLRHVPVQVLTHLQIFRVFVEILLWMLFIQEALPVQMTFEGRNFDILAGLTAPVMAIFFADNRKLMIAWNLISLGLLINIVAIAIVSLPSPLRIFHNEPANTIVAEFPFIFLPTFLVPLAYGLHFLSLRKLTSKL
jgi:hypothetical protein